MYRLRPKSAKQSTKMQLQDTSSLYSKEQEQPIDEKKQSINKRAISNKDRLLSSQYRKNRRQPTTDFLHTKMLPKNIPQDKEVLYYQTIQLKQQNHRVNQENTKLKTKIRVLEKENEKLMRILQTQEEYPQTKSRSRLVSNITGNNESTKIPAMKRLVRQARDEVELLRTQNEKIKKSMKFTKIVELQNQNEVLTDEMAKMTALIDELTAEQNEQQDYKKQVDQLDNYLKVKLSQNQQLAQKIKDLEDQIYKMEETTKANLTKAMAREKRFQKQSQLNKRRLEDAQKEIGILKSDLSKQRQQKLSKPTSSSGMRNPLSKNIRTPLNKVLSVQDSEENKKLTQQICSLRKKNEQLQKKNTDLTSTVKSHESKLLASQRQKISRTKIKSIEEQKEKQKPKQKQKQKNIPSQKIDFEKHDSSIQSYNDDFQQDDKKKTEQKGDQDQNYDIIYDAAEPGNEDDQQQILYQKQKPKSKQKKRSTKSAKKPQSKKKAVSDLKQLLTYRMIAQRYPFEQLKQDIQETGEKSFKIIEISGMLHNNPFFLNNKQVKVLLKILADEEYQNPDFQIPTIQVISTLQSLISDFQLKDPQEDDQMYLKVAQMVTVYTSELEAAFEQKRNPDSMTITQKTLRQLFKELELQKKYVDLIVAELSLVSQDLNHLDYVQFLNRFFIDKDDMGVEQVDEEDEEDNSKTLNKSKRQQEDQSQGSRFKLNQKKK